MQVRDPPGYGNIRVILAKLVAFVTAPKNYLVSPLCLKSNLIVPGLMSSNL